MLAYLILWFTVIVFIAIGILTNMLFFRPDMIRSDMKRPVRRTRLDAVLFGTGRKKW